MQASDRCSSFVHHHPNSTRDFHGGLGSAWADPLTIKVSSLPLDAADWRAFFMSRLVPEEAHQPAVSNVRLPEFVLLGQSIQSLQGALKANYLVMNCLFLGQSQEMEPFNQVCTAQTVSTVPWDSWLRFPLAELWLQLKARLAA